MKFDTTIELDYEDISTSLNYDQSIEFIKIIDRDQENWELTLELAKYFVAEILKLDDPEYTSELYVLLHNGVGN